MKKYMITIQLIDKEVIVRVIAPNSDEARKIALEKLAGYPIQGIPGSIHIERW